jgi:hypothetical protein
MGADCSRKFEQGSAGLRQKALPSDVFVSWKKQNTPDVDNE